MAVRARCTCSRWEERACYGKCAKISNTKVSDKMTYANSANPDQRFRLLLKEQCDQGVHCLPFHYVF